MRTAVGLVRLVSDLDAAGVELLLDRLADPEREVEESAILRLWSQLGTHSAYPGQTPDDVRVLDGSGVTR